MQAHADCDSDDETPLGFELVVNNVPKDVFTSFYGKEELESAFSTYGSHAQFRYVEEYRRVFVLYLLELQCDTALKEMDGFELDGFKLQVTKLKRPSTAYQLKAPRKKRDFVISPPISPPSELLPGLGAVPSLALQAAIASLGGIGSSFVLHPGDKDKEQPEIVVTQD